MIVETYRRPTGKHSTISPPDRTLDAGRKAGSDKVRAVGADRMCRIVTK
jgi:hypothetical protein